VLKFFEGGAQFVLRIHDNRTLPGHRFLNRLAGDEQESNAFIARLNGKFVAVVEENQRAIVEAGRVGELSGSGEHVSESVARGFDRQGFLLTGRHRNVEVDGVGRYAVHRAFFAPERSAYDADFGAVVIGDFGDFRRFDFLIMGPGHFERRGKVGPELETMHAAGFVAFGHLLMDNAAAGGHPLDVACGDGTTISHAVAVFHRSGEDVGNGFDAAVRMPGKSRRILGWDVAAEIIEQQKRVEFGRIAKAEPTAQMDARAFEGGARPDVPLDGPEGHELLKLRRRPWNGRCL